MAGNLGKTRSGAKPKKAKATSKREVAGPYRSQSSVPSIKAKATKKEHRKVPKARAKSRRPDPFAVPPISTSGLTKSQRKAAQTNRKIRAILAPPAAKARARATSASEPKSISTKKVDLIPLAVEKDIIAPAQKANILPEHKTTGQEVYQKIAEWAPQFIVAAPELSAGAKALTAAARGVEAGGVKVGGTSALSRVLGPVKAASPAARAEVALRADAKAAKAIVKEGGVKGTAKRAVARVARTEGKADRALARRVAGTPTRKEVAAQATAPLKVAKVGALQNTAVVRGHEQAIVENPKKVGKTTARILPGFITVPVGIAGHVGTSAGRAGSEVLHEAGVPGFRGYSGKEILAPIKYEGKAQIDFAKEVAKVVTSSDPDYVQKEVEDNLGLLLPITGGLGLKAITDRATAGKIVAGVRKLAEQARRSKVGQKAGLRPHGDLHGPPRVFEKAGQRKTEAKAAANTRLGIQLERADRSREIAKHGTRAKGKEVVRELPTNRWEGKQELAVHAGDAVPFLVRHGIPLDNPKLALAEIKRINDHLVEPSHPLPASELTTRDITGALIRNPGWLTDRHLRAAVEAARSQERYARETPGLSPDHSEAARVSSVAVTHDIPHASERFPEHIKQFTRAQEKVGQDARTTLKKEAHADRRMSNGMLRKAQGAEKKAAIMRRELAIRERMNKERLGVTGLPKAHENLRGRIDKLDLQAASLREKAQRQADIAALKTDTAKDMRNHPGTQKELEDAMVRDVQKVLTEKGLPQPEYAYTGVAREVPVQGAGGQQFSRVPGKSKRKTGRAELTGSVREGLGPYIRDSIGAPVARRHIFAALRDFLGRNQVKAGAKTEFTGSEARSLLDDPKSGVTRDSHVLIPTQLTKRAFDFVKKDSKDLTPGESWVKQMQGLFNEHEQSLILNEGRGRTYHIVRRPAAEEFFAQMTSARMSKTLSRVNHATSYLILATSPAWAVMQIAAEYAQAAAAEPRLLNPAWVHKTIKAYHDMAPEKRRAFESWTGVTQRNVEHSSDVQLGMETGSDLASADATFNVLNRMPGGRIIRSIPNTIRAIDQWKGGRIRVLTAAAKIDREMNGHLNGFLRGTGGLYREQAALSRKLKGQSRTKQLEYWADHPEVTARYQSYLDDMLGNWTALTRNERLASQLVIFYPFIRMSLRWSLYTFPKHHPLRAAVSAWLGQQNANELSKLLHGDPSFFSQWGTVPLHLGENETSLMDLSRIAPGSNALIEATGGGGGTLGSIAARAAQPIVSAGLAGGFGINTLSGKQEAHSGAQAANEILSLSPISRTGEKLLLGDEKRTEGAVKLFGSTERQNSLDKLFAKLRDSELTQTARTLAFPVIPKNVEHERDVAKLGRILKRLEDNSTNKRHDRQVELAEQGAGTPGAREILRMKETYYKANDELDKMFTKYRVPYEKENRRFFREYSIVGEGEYGGKSSGGGGLGGSALSGSLGGGGL